MVKITDAAKQKFLEIVKVENRTDDGLRIIVRGGGTPNPEFGLNFVGADQVTADDTVVDSGGFKVFLDPTSAKYLEGASVDYIDELSQSGFKVDAPNAGISVPSGPVADKINQVLTDQINPAIASHGGQVSLVAIEEETAYLLFGGGCQGCGMINVTLKQGVEKVIFTEVPQITKVMDVTDHAAGTNPYYQPGK
jgi:Fe/S biogenesis protein NfuA